MWRDGGIPVDWKALQRAIQEIAQENVAAETNSEPPSTSKTTAS